MIDAQARERIGLARLERSPSIAARLRVAGEIILGLVLVLSAYGWHQERDIADAEKARAEVAERRLAVCTGCAQSWNDYRAATNHRRGAK